MHYSLRVAVPCKHLQNAVSAVAFYWLERSCSYMRCLVILSSKVIHIAFICQLHFSLSNLIGELHMTKSSLLLE